MTDRESLYRAILAAPDDDAPRLVYADWLDEHGEPARAEFIRFQCELGQLLLGTQTTFDRYKAIQTRCHALFENRHGRWIHELGPLPPERQLQIWFRRGMASKIVCPVEYFLAHGDRLFDLIPLEEVEFTQLGPAHVRPLASCPGSGRVRRFRYLSPDGSSHVVRSLLANWPFPELRVLELRVRAADFQRAGCASAASAIAGADRLQTLRRLSLARCGIGDTGGQALADSPHLEDLSVLDLTDNPLGPGVRYRLLDRFGLRVIFDYRDHAGFRVRDLFG